MADYAGTILQIAGAATGQVWLQAAGMAVSAWAASQEVIPGPKIGEIQQQTAQEGGPRPFVFGRSHPIAGNVIADGGPRIVVTRERQGKGGPKVESESAFRTYAVAFCEGEADLLQVWRNNTLVYDAEDAGMAAENAEFLKYARWFRGDYQQMPSPDLEAVLGAGNVHGHRGTAYLVLADEDVTDQRGAWSQWKVRVFRGAAKSYTTPPYPAHDEERHAISVLPLGGVLRSIMQKTDAEESHSISVIPLGGNLRTPLVTTEAEESHSISVLPLGGSLSLPLQHTDSEASHSIEVSPTGGNLRLSLIRGEGEHPEHTITIIPLGGKLS